VFLAAGLVGAGVGWFGAQALAESVAAATGLSLVISWSGDEGILLGALALAGLLGALVPALFGYQTSVRKSLLGQ